MEHDTDKLYDAIVQRLVTSKWARELGHDELADQSIDEALAVARQLASRAAWRLLQVTADAA